MKKSRWIAGGVALLLLLISVAAVSALTYQIRWGDTLYHLARRFGTSIDAIVAANDKITNPNLIYAGDTIEIPEDGVTPTPVTPTGTPPTVTPTPTTPPGGGTVYIVRFGDTLFSIARRFNTTVSAIALANNLANVNLIYVGQRLIIPGPGGGTPTPVTPTPTSPPPDSDFALGGQSLNLNNEERMTEAGMTWLKIQYPWESGDDPGEVADDIELAHANDFKILLSITGATPYPAPNSIDFNSFIDFVRGVAALGPDAIEVWNEMNIDFEWPAGQISPTSYVNNMLAPVYTAVKAEDPNILVIGGALAPTGFDNNTNAWADSRYLAGLRAAGAANYMDCIGMHHNAGATSPSATSGHPADPGDRHYSWYFRPTLDLYYNSFNGQEQICITELGYLSPEGFDGLPDNFSWAAGTSVAEQAAWLAEAVQIAASSDRVTLVIIYNVDFIKYEPEGDPQAGYAIIRPDTTCPACETLGNVMN